MLPGTGMTQNKCLLQDLLQQKLWVYVAAVIISHLECIGGHDRSMPVTTLDATLIISALLGRCAGGHPTPEVLLPE